jgi:hypothetical protein
MGEVDRDFFIQSGIFVFFFIAATFLHIYDQDLLNPFQLSSNEVLFYVKIESQAGV